MSITMKRHYHLLLGFVGVLLVLLAGFGEMQIVAYTNHNQIESAVIPSNYDNSLHLFDNTVVHEIQIIAPADTQQRMIKTYQLTGEKDYFGVDVIIDGVRVDNVGIRLKGNASLMSVAKADDFFGGLGGPTFFPPELSAVPQHCWEFSPIAQPGVESDKEETDRLPYLIKFDAFVPGQTYQGYTEFAVRTSGVEADAAQMQEPLTNYALNQMGIPASETAYISLRLNNDAPQLYSIAETLGQAYIDKHFPGSEGTLYKVVEVSNDFAYLGDDLPLYANVFDQKTAINDADLTPLIQFMKFVSQSDDASFARDLGDWLDLDAFTTYLAVENLLVNYDSLAGMGNNYYLYYDEINQQFTVLAWDANESLGKLGTPTFDLYWTDRFAPPGTGLGGGSPAPAEGIVSDADIPAECAEAFEKLANLAPSPDGDAQAEPLSPADGGGPFGDGKHILKDRFLANADFRTLYETKLQIAYDEIFGKGLLEPQIAVYTTLLTNYNRKNRLFDQAEFDLAIQNMQDFISQREMYLHSTELLGRSE